MKAALRKAYINIKNLHIERNALKDANLIDSIKYLFSFFIHFFLAFIQLCKVEHLMHQFHIYY